MNKTIIAVYCKKGYVSERRFVLTKDLSNLSMKFIFFLIRQELSGSYSKEIINGFFDISKSSASPFWDNHKVKLDDFFLLC